MKHKNFLTRLEEIKNLVIENSNLFNEKDLLKLVEEFEDKIRKSAKWPKDVSSVLAKLKRKNLNSIRTLAKQARIEIDGSNKWSIIFEIGLKLMNNGALIETLASNMKTKKKKTKKKDKGASRKVSKISEEGDVKEIIMKWIDMREEELRNELEKMTVKEIRDITKDILPYSIRKKKKKELIEAIVFKMSEIRHHFKMGPA